MKRSSSTSPGHLRRLVEEIEEELPTQTGLLDDTPLAWEELAYALRPPVHEGRVATYGAIIGSPVEPEVWTSAIGLTVHYRMARSLSHAATRRFADGISSWVLRGAGRDQGDDGTELVVFDRPAASERDLVVMAEAADGVVVQRHPSGPIRLVGPFGVVRATVGGWQHQPPVDRWLDAVAACQTVEQQRILKRLLRFAVHDLGSRRIGALLVYHVVPPDRARYELRLPEPPPLSVQQPVNLAPLHHVLGQLDGAAMFDETGTLTALGARLVPTRDAEENVRPIGGTRHTSARRYSYDEPHAIVIAVSEDGPVSVFRRGEVLGRSQDGDEAMMAPPLAPVEDQAGAGSFDTSMS